MSDSVPKSSAPNEGAIRLPAKIGRYDVLEKLGAGGTGTVFRATDPFIGRILAIKVFRVDLPPGPQRDRFLQRFYHEARISGGLSHPNIVALFDVGEMEGVPYLVFEHVEGPTLDVAIARSGRLDSTETIRVLEQTAAAMDFAHSKGIVHRDIRPANIILASDKRVRIADFGIARIEGSQLTQHGEILGTPAYMSPEQIRGNEITASSDLFALAVCAYEMLTGQRPFVGKTQSEMLEALVYSPPAEPKELRALGIPSRDFMFVFERALAKEPTHRFGDGSAFVRALKSCLGFVTPGDAPAPVSRIAIPDPLPSMAVPPATPPPPPSQVVDTGATGVLEIGQDGASDGSAEATMVSPSMGSNPADDSEATLVSTIGFEKALTAKKSVSPADATMVSPNDSFELPATTRLSRQAVESLLSKSSPAQPNAASASPVGAQLLQKTLPGAEKPSEPPASALESLAPPTREMPSLPSPPPPDRYETAETLHDATRTDRPPAGASKQDDKTLIMSESEKAAAVQLRDRSAAKLPPTTALPRPDLPPTATMPRPTPPQGSHPPSTRPTASRPPTQPPAVPHLGPPRPSLVPKIILASLALLILLALAVGVIFWGGAGRQAQTSGEKWNDLPVYSEAEVEKSPLLLTHDMPEPKVERSVSVTVSWIVTPDGVVDDPKIVASASEAIDALMVEAVRKWRYQPGQKGGKTVPVRVLRKYTFGRSQGS
ncbi:MAG: protein kinase [Vicinamibacteria bacterium]|nr:protein kinase [Vicinamibacteria bacterium]